MIRIFIAMMTVLVTAGVSGGVVSAQAALTCSQFTSQAEAQAAYALDPTDPAGNDEDGDGIACEDVIYGDTTRDLTVVSRGGATGSQAPEGAPGIGAAGIVPAASQASETTEPGIGASGIVSAAPQASGSTERGIGASGTTTPRGVGASGTVSNERGAVVGSMSAMPSTGVGPAEAGSWLIPVTLLLVAGAAGWTSIQVRLSAARAVTTRR